MNPVDKLLGELVALAKPLDEHKIADAIWEALSDPIEMEEFREQARADFIAFRFIGRLEGDSEWGTHFGPFATGVDNTGAPFAVPAISEVTVAAVNQWQSRARALNHPVLVARFADLAWDLARTAGTKPDPNDARLAIDAYIASTSDAYRDDLGDQLQAAVRAFDVALQLKDDTRIAAARDALLRLHNAAVAAQQWWWIAPARLFRDRRTPCTEAERLALVASLEQLVSYYGNQKNKAAFDPHQQQSAAGFLINHYRSQELDEEAERLEAVVARTFEFAASQVEPLVAPMFLQEAASGFRRAGMRDESARARILMEDAHVASKDAMSAISFETKMSNEDFERVMNDLVRDDIGATLVRIAANFRTRKVALEKLLKSISAKAPLQSLISIQIVEDNQVAAVVGPLSDDPVGRLVYQASQQIDLGQVWMAEAIERAIVRHNLTPQLLASWINRHELFADTRLLVQGLGAWFACNNPAALHLLIPQVEVAFRSIAKSLGLPVTKSHPKISNASVAVNMGDIISNDAVVAAIGQDTALHFRALYSDPRGKNLRNRVAHGLYPADSIDPSITRAVVHSLLMLGIWKELAAREPLSA